MAIVCPLPSLENPLVFYSNQNRSDFRLALKQAFSKAKKNIRITIYAISDPLLLRKLHEKSKENIEIEIFHDRSNKPSISSLKIRSKAIKSKGLMHRKIITIDDKIAFLGSANLTTSSLVLHDNLSVGIYHPGLINFLTNPQGSYFDFKIQTRKCRLWLLPSKEAWLNLQQQIEMAKTSIFVAMFTLTDPNLIRSLALAHQRGVDVTIILDHYTAQGASSLSVTYLEDHGVNLRFSQGLQLLHHKLAYIDKKQVILGSTNWTKAAFTKNEDCILIFDSLTPQDLAFFDQLQRKILLESKSKL